MPIYILEGCFENKRLFKYQKQPPRTGPSIMNIVAISFIFYGLFKVSETQGSEHANA